MLIDPGLISISGSLGRSDSFRNWRGGKGVEPSLAEIVAPPTHTFLGGLDGIGHDGIAHKRKPDASQGIGHAKSQTRFLVFRFEDRFIITQLQIGERDIQGTRSDAGQAQDFLTVKIQDPQDPPHWTGRRQFQRQHSTGSGDDPSVTGTEAKIKRCPHQDIRDPEIAAFFSPELHARAPQTGGGSAEMKTNLLRGDLGLLNFLVRQIAAHDQSASQPGSALLTITFASRPLPREESTAMTNVRDWPTETGERSMSHRVIQRS